MTARSSRALHQSTIGDYRRVSASDSRSRRRSLGRDRGHACPLRSNQVRITSNPGETFIDRMIALVEGAERQKTPNEIALNILLAGLTIIFLLAVVTLQPFAIYSGDPQTIFVLVSLLGADSDDDWGFAFRYWHRWYDRLIQHNVLAMSGRAVEAAGDVNTLLLDKTGTITFGNRHATAFIPLPGVDETELAEAAQLSSLADETPEGRGSSCWQRKNTDCEGASWRRTKPISSRSQHKHECPGSISTGAKFVKVRQTRFRISSIHLETGTKLINCHREEISRAGGTPLVVAEDRLPLGVIHLKDIVKGGMMSALIRCGRWGSVQ